MLTSPFGEVGGRRWNFFTAIYLFIYLLREDFLVIFFSSFFLHFFKTKDVRTSRRHTLTYIGWGRPRKKNLFWRRFSCFICFRRGKVFCYLIILFIYGWITVYCLELYAYEVAKHNGLLMEGNEERRMSITRLCRKAYLRGGDKERSQVPARWGRCLSLDFEI